MNTKIIIILIAVLGFVPAAYASEITGTLTSSGVQSNGSSSSGTIGGTVTGGGSGSSGSGGGGGTTSGTVAPPGSNNTNGAGNSISSEDTSTGNGQSLAFAPNNGFVPAGTVTAAAGNGNNVNEPAADETPQVVAVAEPGFTPGANNQEGLGLAAQAGGAFPIGKTISWILFGILLVGIGVYFYRRYARKTA